VPTPAFAVIERVADIGNIVLPFPLFLKPVAEGSGKGVNARSKVTNATELKSIVAELLARFRQPVLVETYLPGREFTVGIVGTGDEARTLGVMEIIPTKNAATVDYGLENKDNCAENIVYRLIEDSEAREAADVALAAWRALRCRDGGRIDIRSDAEGRPHFIEVNPLAGLNPEHSDLCFIARFRGLAYQELIGLIMSSFLKRHPELASRRAAA
jgi:D-alanine-D-alanine ligase